MLTKSVRLNFFPLNFSWVALHPNPQGVVFFIGGAFFGTFPTFFYRFLLKDIFNQRYTIVALPYRFSLRHWSVATTLVKDKESLISAIIDEAQHRGYSSEIYKTDPTSTTSNFFWLGHSLGCKYIALLELLTNLEDKNENKRLSLVKSFTQGNCIPLKEQKNLEAILADVDLEKISLKNQPSLLMAPAIEGLEGAIPIFRNGGFAELKKLLNNLGIKVEPSQTETFCLIKEKKELFNLTSLIYFTEDTRVAAPTVNWLITNIKDRLVKIKALAGKHLAPLGWQNGDPEIPATVLEFLKTKL
jgi:hypothetical protein